MVWWIIFVAVGKHYRGKASCECPSNVCTQSLRACHVYIQSVSLCGAWSPNLLLEEVYIIQAFFFFFLFCLQSCFSNSSPQNRFSSKIAIKSLWKFMSIVAAIWREKRTTKYFLYIHLHHQLLENCSYSYKCKYNYNLLLLFKWLLMYGAHLWQYTIISIPWN